MPQVDETSFTGQTVLITGGAGFIGSHLAHRLLELGSAVRVLDDLSGGFAENLPAGADLIEASILDDKAMRRAATGCSYIFHQAAMVSVPESIEQPERCLAVNVEGTQKVLLAARDGNVRRVLFAASAAAYGENPDLPCREIVLPQCVSPYAAGKVAGEMLMRAFAHSYGISTVSLRYFNIFGPRQNPDSPYAAVISAFIRALERGRMPRIFGDGAQTRDFTYIDNVVHANLLAAASPRDFRGEIINIGTGSRVSLLDVIEAMGRAIGREVMPEFAEPRKGDVPHSQASIDRARELLGYEPIVPFEEGVCRTLAAAGLAAEPDQAKARTA